MESVVIQQIRLDQDGGRSKFFEDERHALKAAADLVWPGSPVTVTYPDGRILALYMEKKARTHG